MKTTFNIVRAKWLLFGIALALQCAPVNASTTVVKEPAVVKYVLMPVRYIASLFTTPQ